MNTQKDWKAKLESAYSFMIQYSKITVSFEIHDAPPDFSPTFCLKNRSSGLDLILHKNRTILYQMLSI